MKRLFSIIIAMAFILSAAAVCRGETYWDFQADYLQALESKDGDAVISCVKRLEKIYSNPTNDTEYTRLATPLENAALEYEKKNMFTEAKEYYEKSYKCYKWLDNHGAEYYDKLMILDGIIAHMEGMFEVYAEAAEPKQYPYYNEINEPEFGTYYGSCGIHPGERSAQLIYVQYFNEEIYSYDYAFDPNCSVVELAWNVPNENYSDLVNVAASENIDYMKRNVDFLASLGQKILLRFGAEVNCWTDLNNYRSDAEKKQFTDAFKKAFRLISEYVHENAPNVAMVFSPNDVSNWYYSPKDFYPGDEYVDWVGLSSYGNISAAAANTVGSMTDAHYCRGVYENQIMGMREIVNEFGSRKPIVISECGFCYSSATTAQTAEHAAKSLKYFYTYVNRVFPQVKAIFYFNTDFGANKYLIAGNEDVERAYRDAVLSNVSMQSTVGGEKAYYTEFSKVNEKRDSLRISAFAYYPHCELTVSYKLDGNEVYKSSNYPYEYTLSSLTPGVHKMSVALTAGSTVVTKNYGIFVDENGRMSTLISAMKDVAHSSWAYAPVAYCLHEGLFAGTAPTDFSPDSPMTRAMLVTVLYRLDGKPNVGGSDTPFEDVEDGTWYTAAVKWARNNNIVSGVSETSFAPNMNITREQTAAMLYRYARYKGYDTESKNDVSGRPDYDSISDYAVKNISWANYYGIISGDEKGYINPKNSATRAEVATMLRSFKTKLMKS